MATVASRKPRIPLAAVDAVKTQVYRDPVKRAARPYRAAAAAASNAIHTSLSKANFKARPLRILRSSSASNVVVSKATITEKQTGDLLKPTQIAGRKRRANSAEPGPARVVRARLSADEAPITVAVPKPTDRVCENSAAAKPSSAKSDITVVEAAENHVRDHAWTESQSASSVQSRSDSLATAVEDVSKQAEVPQRKIAKPSRAFSTLRSLSGSAAFELPPKAQEAPVKDWDDIDADDGDDPLMVSEYISEIMEYMCELEKKSMPDELYMGKQKELTWDMRRVLVNWLVQIHYQLHMLPETLFLAVNLVDRFLSLRQVSVAKLQLVGLTGLLIACKYEEMTTPHMQDFAYLAGNCYSVKEIMNAEVFMLRVLDFDLSYPSPLTFLRRVSKAEQYNMQTRTVAKYLMEICLVDHRLMAFKPSHIAAAGICLARRMLKAGAWDGNLRHYSGFSEADLQPCIALMLDHLMRPMDNEFVFKKYQHKRYLKASLFCREWVARHRHELQPVTPPVGSFSDTVKTNDAAS
ncbi:A/B/D/E cyclin [Coemansia reversa NRRL 1564]|uniref:A/B/D/E cyclin n=1 Tax=Coemansia reversa (strain ATCC 12441 / NRRL 1564) TaxID=763665 RepID=A0A2G5BKM5_COERN|nr:A/B/D/E cyclin [Coemansia reversa NRRL 1564]|eukprot:PIA19565.1 A/B/D/E cyclin [Coemansia reversa NRRL 1564]